MKKIIYLCMFIFHCAIAHNLTIYYDSPTYDAFGYDHCDIKANGELDVIRTFIPKEGIICDVGANVGDWSIEVIARGSAHIFAFEPLPDMFEILAARMKNQANYTAFNSALSDRTGEQTFVYYKQFSPLSSFYHRQAVEKQKTFTPTEITVQTDTIDHVCSTQEISHINFLKIDTEGAELLVLKGARALLEKGAIDFIQFEYGGTYQDAGITLKEVYHLLSSHHYCIFRIVPRGLIYIPVWRESLENWRHSNYVAIRKEKTLSLFP